MSAGCVVIASNIANHTEIIETSFQILKSNTSMNKVLDFGCGMGRNLNYLKTISKYGTIAFCVITGSRLVIIF